MRGSFCSMTMPAVGGVSKKSLLRRKGIYMDGVYFFQAVFGDGSEFTFAHDDISESESYYWHWALNEALILSQEREGLNFLYKVTYND